MLRDVTCQNESCDNDWSYNKQMTDLLHQHFCSLDCAREFFDSPDAGRGAIENEIEDHDFSTDFSSF